MAYTKSTFKKRQRRRYHMLWRMFFTFKWQN